jgi:hypothetical protein
MLSKISRSIISSIVALLLYVTLVVSFITIFDKGQFLTFDTLWLTFFTLCTPPFILIGIPATYVLQKRSITWRTQFFLYVVFGGIVSIEYAAILFDVTKETWYQFMVFGLVAGFIYYWTIYLFSIFIFKKKPEAETVSMK